MLLFLFTFVVHAFVSPYINEIKNNNIAYTIAVYLRVIIGKKIMFTNSLCV